VAVEFFSADTGNNSDGYFPVLSELHGVICPAVRKGECGIRDVN
jgi:hypothetical protein